MAEESGDLIGELAGAIDALVAAGPEAVSDTRAVAALVRQSQRLAAVVSLAANAMETSGEWQVDGACSASSWLASRCRLPRGEANRLCRLGRSMGEMPVATEAWLAGEIGPTHVGILASLATGRTAESFARDEAMLVEHARGLSFHQFCQAAGYWDQLLGATSNEHAGCR